MNERSEKSLNTFKARGSNIETGKATKNSKQLMRFSTHGLKNVKHLVFI